MYQYEQRMMGVSVRTERDGCISTNREGWVYQYEQRGMGVSVRTENDGCISTNREGWVYQYEQRGMGVSVRTERDGWRGGVNRACLVRVKRERETDREGDGNRQGGRWKQAEGGTVTEMHQGNHPE